MSLVKITAAGDRALLADLGDLSADELHRIASAVHAAPGVVASVPGQRSLLVVFDGPPDPESIRGARASSSVPGPSRNHRIVVSFREDYGPDLAELGVEREIFLERVSALRLVVRYIGFRGGFGYLDGWPAEWALPRRQTSRPRVAAGSFAIAGSVAGFYPVDSPGGWNLLGRTDYPLEHALRPGDTIEIEASLEALAPKVVGRTTKGESSELPLRLISSPLTAIVERRDWSRTASGRPPGGPFDEVAAASANEAVGNVPDAPLLESALVGPRAIAMRDVFCSWYGSQAPVHVDGVAVGDPRLFQVAAGQEIVVGRISDGMRGWLAVGGRRGRVKTIDRGNRLTIEAIAGPHEVDLRELECEVTAQLDRVGIRMRALSPAGLTAPGSLPSCGMQLGTIQLHPDGSVVAMGPDHPVTGGYLQPMTVISSEIWKLAQLAPGDRVRFVAASQSLSP